MCKPQASFENAPRVAGSGKMYPLRTLFIYSGLTLYYISPV